MHLQHIALHVLNMNQHINNKFTISVVICRDCFLINRAGYTGALVYVDYSLGSGMYETRLTSYKEHGTSYKITCLLKDPISRQSTTSQQATRFE